VNGRNEETRKERQRKKHTAANWAFAHTSHVVEEKTRKNVVCNVQSSLGKKVPNI